MIECVRVNCGGDVEQNGRPKFKKILLPSDHAIFQQSPTEISAQVGLPIVAARIPGNVDKWVESKCGYICNEPITFLHIGCDPRIEGGSALDGGPGWGTAPLSWGMEVGSCIVARKDRKLLEPEHIEAMAKYCQVHLTNRFEEFNENEDNEDEDTGNTGRLGVDYVLLEITKNKFEAYFLGWRVEQNESRSKDKSRRIMSEREVARAVG